MNNSTRPRSFNGVLVRVMKFGRVFGLCPLLLSPELVVSKWLTMYGYFVVLPLLSSIYIYKILNINPDDQPLIAQFTDVLPLMSLTILSLLIASKRMKHWIQCLHKIDDILTKKKTQQKNQSWCVVLSLAYIFLFGFELLEHLFTCLEEYEIPNFFNLALLSFTEYFISNTSIFLLILIILRIKTAFVVVNDNLVELMTSSDNNKQNKPNKMINNYFALESNHRQVHHLNTEEELPHQIRYLSLSYMKACESVQIITQSDGVLMLLALLVYTVRIPLSILHLIGSTDENGKITQSSYYLEIICSIFYVTVLLVLTEPCHHLHKQMSVTNSLVNEFKNKMYLHQGAYNELTLFSYTLELNKQTFSPLDLCTLARPLVAKILGAIVTYLLAIIQLQRKH